MAELIMAIILLTNANDYKTKYDGVDIYTFANA